jgi:uncharacterized protein YbjQ (UPF0145 family)
MIELILFVVFLGLGFTAGTIIEHRHFRHLDAREAELKSIFFTNLRTPPLHWKITQPQLVTGVAVISTDYFKTVAAALRGIFGGRVRSLETLVERARRQAIVRMLDEARAQGANAIWNVRLETTTIGNSKGKPSAIEVMAYGTALRAE